MTGTGKLAATMVGAIFLLSALGADGQQSPPSAADTQSETIAAPVLTAKRVPADMPPSPPKVTCDGGQLTISAQNSTLGAVLNAIRGCTGAEIDVPAEASGERLFAELGPGPVRAVLADFLNSTDFNFVIKASLSDPQKVQMVLLNPRITDSATEVATVAESGTSITPNRLGWLKARENYTKSFTAASAANDEASQPADTASSASPPVETAVSPSGSTPVDTTAPSANPVPVGSDPVGPALSTPALSPATNPIASGSSGSDAPLNQGKSTQEMITDMQRMFEQRKQMIQQQAPPVH
jgi:hypothetical protein